MKNKVLCLVLLLFLGLPSISEAVVQYVWRYREAATDCTAITDGKGRDLCREISTSNLYTCMPNAGVSGTCTTASEWKPVGGIWTDTGIVVSLTKNRDVLLGNHYLRGDSIYGLQLDTNGDGAVEAFFYPSGLLSTGGGLEYTGSNSYANVARATDVSTPTNGDFWYNTATNLFKWQKGATLMSLSGGSDTQVLINNGSLITGDSTFTFNSSTKVLSTSEHKITGAATSGGVLCTKSDGNIGQCASAVGSGGTCTCN